MGLPKGRVFLPPGVDPASLTQEQRDDLARTQAEIAAEARGRLEAEARRRGVSVETMAELAVERDVRSAGDYSPL